MNKEKIIDNILLIISGIIFIGFTIYYLIAGNTTSSVIYLFSIMISISLIFTHLFIKRKKA